MDSKTINAIREGQAKINETCEGTDLAVMTPTRIIVERFDEIEAIADIIYGDEAHKYVSAEFENDWTYAAVDSPEGVHFFYEKMNTSLADLVSENTEVCA